MALCCVKIQQPSNSCLSLSDLCTLSLCLMKLTRQTCSTAYRDQNPGIRPPTAVACATTRGQRLLELSHAPPKILDSQLGSQSHTPPRRPCRPPIYLLENLLILRTHTRLHALLSICLITMRWNSPSRAEEHMLMSSGDIVTSHQQLCKHLHISPSPRQRHVIR